MRAPLFVRTITEDEQGELGKGLRSSSAFTVRRSQIVLMSSQEKLTAREIGERLRCSDQCVREAIRAFERAGLNSLKPTSRARHDDQQALDAAGREWLQGVIRRSPREFGFEGSLWTLDWLAELAAREGYAPKQIDRTTMSRLLSAWALAGGEPNTGSPAPTASMRSKKAARLAEAADCPARGVAVV